MGAKFIISECCNNSDPHGLVLKYLICIENMKNSYKNHKVKSSAQTWKYKFEVPDGSYSM